MNGKIDKKIIVTTKKRQVVLIQNFLLLYQKILIKIIGISFSLLSLHIENISKSIKYEIRITNLVKKYL